MKSAVHFFMHGSTADTDRASENTGNDFQMTENTENYFHLTGKVQI